MAVSRQRGKDAVTEFRVIKRDENVSLLLVKLLTGRTHQTHDKVSSRERQPGFLQFRSNAGSLRGYRGIWVKYRTGNKGEFRERKFRLNVWYP